MIRNSRTYTVSSQEELEQTWSTPELPNMGFVFNELTLDECVDNGDGTWEATYDSILIPDGGMSFTYLTADGEYTYTVAAGEYGIRA